MDMSSLKHIRRKLPSGGQVIVVDNGAVLNAEALAMIQALHSRSIGGFDAHMETLAQKGPQKFIETFYSGYGHKSIGDCGTATVFVEGVSMLVPKSIQDWPHYNGQEASTRFMNFSKQPFLNPLGTQEGEEIQEEWRNAYLFGLEYLKTDLKSRFPRNEGEDEKVYEKAINARAFDIMRSFLPAGATTNFAWTMNLRQFNDELLWLRHHPLKEVCNVAEATEDALAEMYPASFLKKRHSETEEYVESMSSDLTYFDQIDHPTFNLRGVNIDWMTLNTYGKSIFQRPAKTELPKKIAECGTLSFDFLLDFGSFRDIQRHRAVVQQMPLLGTHHGFHPWYIKEVGNNATTEKLAKIIAKQTKKITSLPTSAEIKQYYIAMGFNTPNRLTGNLHALTYLVELRNTRFVHPTLRERVLQMAEVLKRYIPVLHLDPEPGRFDIMRGTHDITFG